MERPKLSARMSELTVGKGEISRTDDLNKIELHLNVKEYSAIVTHRGNTDMFIVKQNVGRPEAKSSGSPRHVEAILPKTYITKAGTLFLYSDGKVGSRNPASPTLDQNQLGVRGKSVKPGISSAVPKWAKLVTVKKTEIGRSTCRSKGMSKDDREYIMKDPKTTARKPYSWNYSVTPVKVISNDTISTLKDLSDAVLSYRQQNPTKQDIYIEQIRQAWKTQPETTQRKKPKVSEWTHEWINSQRSFVMEEQHPVISRRRHGHVTSKPFDRVNSSLSNITRQGRAPTNTPQPVAVEAERAMTSSKLATYHFRPDTSMSYQMID